MVVSDGDRRRMRELARDLAEVETDTAPPEPVVKARIAAANAYRAAHGRPPLVEDNEPPEEELYRRARALGLS